MWASDFSRRVDLERVAASLTIHVPDKRHPAVGNAAEGCRSGEQPRPDRSVVGAARNTSAHRSRRGRGRRVCCRRDMPPLARASQPVMATAPSARQLACSYCWRTAVTMQQRRGPEM